MSKKTTTYYQCSDIYYYDIIDLSSGKKWAALPEDIERTAWRVFSRSLSVNGCSSDMGLRKPSAFSNILPTSIVPCWRSKVLPAKKGYSCGNEPCIKIIEPSTFDIEKPTAAKQNTRNAFGVFLPCLITWLVLWILLCWGPDRCSKIRHCKPCPKKPSGVAPEVAKIKWNELSDEERGAAKVLGQSEKTWNEDLHVASEDKTWRSLTDEEKEAATVLKYNEDSWNNS
jgi:hypothetical protein